MCKGLESLASGILPTATSQKLPHIIDVSSHASKVSKVSEVNLSNFTYEHELLVIINPSSSLSRSNREL